MWPVCSILVGATETVALLKTYARLRSSYLASVGSRASLEARKVAMEVEEEAREERRDTMDQAVLLRT